MRKVVMAVMAALLLAAQTAGGNSAPFSPCVDDKGNISLPEDYRSNWMHLGSWAVPAPTDPGSGFHDVYTQPESIKYYLKNRKFPDGAVLVMEVRKAVWDEVPTGHAVYAGEDKTWFVMVKDTKGRFQGNPNWGDGWGWAQFKAEDPERNISTNYMEDCIPCHEPVKDTDWVYVYGYPTLR